MYYPFTNVKTQEARDFYFPSKDAPKIGSTVEIDGESWRREIAIPQVAIDTKIDAFSQKEFREKTYAKKGETLGSMWDRSAELSEQRAAKLGAEDPVKQKYFKDYRKKNKKGIPHLSELNQNHKKAQKKLDNVIKEAAKKLGID